MPGVRDPLTGSRERRQWLQRAIRQTATRVRATVPLTGRPMIVDFNEGAADDGANAAA